MAHVTETYYVQNAGKDVVYQVITREDASATPPTLDRLIYAVPITDLISLAMLDSNGQTAPANIVNPLTLDADIQALLTFYSFDQDSTFATETVYQV